MPQAPTADVAALASDVFDLIKDENAPLASARVAAIGSSVRARVEGLRGRVYVGFMVAAYDLVDRLCGFGPDQLAEERDTPRRRIVSENLSLLLTAFHDYRNPPKSARSRRSA